MEKKNTDDELILCLKNELQKRVKKNSSYSLRALAKSLNIDPSLLSKHLNGKRKLSRKTKDKISMWIKQQII